VAQAIAMLLHELTTNAAKYGALSEINGHIEISGCVFRQKDWHGEFYWLIMTVAVKLPCVFTPVPRDLDRQCADGIVVHGIHLDFFVIAE
jgi:two-component sensor histidine kinase